MTDIEFEIACERFDKIVEKHEEENNKKYDDSTLVRG